jgi:hypothetical protein
MNTMRQFLRDRLSAGAIVAMIAYVLLLQAFVTGIAQGEMMRAVGDPLLVVCSSDTVAATGAAPSKADHGSTKHVPCPCATLCHVVVADNPSVPVAVPAPAYDALAGLNTGFATRPAFPAPDVHALLAEARAPPVLSV